MKRARHKRGSVVFDKRRRTWNFLWCENGHRITKVIGPIRDFPTKKAALDKSEDLKKSIMDEREDRVKDLNTSPTLTVRKIVADYRIERMPPRLSTRRGYEAWLNNHILPRWGTCGITELQARPVELWLRSLALSPKSKVHIRGVIHALWGYAMWCNHVPNQLNPMSGVEISNATKIIRKPRSLKVEEFRLFSRHLMEPFHTIALLCVSMGLRISECLALKWNDVDWATGQLRIERAIVRQHVDDVKTAESRKMISTSVEMLGILKMWRHNSQFSSNDDWMFASTVQLGRLPISYPWVWLVFQKASANAGIGKLSTHSLRHSYRSWLDMVGTGIAVQQQLMRHSDIRTTMNTYGDVVSNEMAIANSKVANLALGG